MWREIKRLMKAGARATKQSRPRPSGKPAPGHANQREAEHFSDSDIEIVKQSAQRLADVVNESMNLAKTSSNADTKVSRLGVAKQRLAELKKMARDYPFLELTGLEKFEAQIAATEAEFKSKKYGEIADGNQQGSRLEKEGKHEEAITVYSRLAESGADTPFTYRRLAILYRKQNDVEREIRILELAMKNVPATNAKHYQWFEDRYQKIRAKHGMDSDDGTPPVSKRRNK